MKKNESQYCEMSILEKENTLKNSIVSLWSVFCYFYDYAFGISYFCKNENSHEKKMTMFVKKSDYSHFLLENLIYIKKLGAG